MNTDFDRLRSYYSQFDEWRRIETPSGRMEYEIMLRILCRRLTNARYVLDLGGGPGRYTFMLAERGYRMTLADISPKLVEEAAKRAAALPPSTRKNIARIDVANALDLSLYDDDSFDAVLAFGPFYHLGMEGIRTSLGEIGKKLRPGGVLFSIFIPYEVGLRHLVERSCLAPDEVDLQNLKLAIETGHFRSNSAEGFQEAYFARAKELTDLFEEQGFLLDSIRSIRGIGFGNEKVLLERRQSDPTFFDSIMDLVDLTSENPSIVNTGGHALIIAKNGERAI